MPNEIIIPSITIPEITGLSSTLQRMQESITNSPFLKISDEFAKNVKSMQEKFNASALVAARGSAIMQMESIFENSAIAEMQRNQDLFVKSIIQFQAPAAAAMKGILESMPKFVFQPTIYTTPKQNFQKPSIDLPSVIISGKKASLHFNGEAIALGNAKTQVAKAAQYLCDNIGNEVDLAMLYTYCKDPERGKRSSLVKNISMDDRYKRGAATISDLYKTGFGEVFFLDGYWQSGKKKIIPILKK